LFLAVASAHLQLQFEGAKASRRVAQCHRSTMSSSPPPPTIKRLPLDRSRTGLLMARMSTRNLYDLQLKSADYEAMMDRFQLRKTSKSSVEGGKFKHAVIDTVYGTKRKAFNWRMLSPRNLFLLLTRRKTWRHVWKTLTTPISSGSATCTVHGLFMFVVNQFELFYLAFSLSFYPNGSAGTASIGVMLQQIHLFNLMMNLNTAFMRHRELVTARREIARDHVSKWFALELLSSVPVGIVYYLPQASTTQVAGALLHYDEGLIALRLMRLFFAEQSMVPRRVFRDNKLLVSWFLYSRYAHLLGIAKLIWLVLLVTHYMACVWYVLADHHATMSTGEQYVASFYYAVQLIQGQGNFTGTWEENLFSTFVILIGSVILAIVFGEVAMLVSNFNANTTSYRQKMEGVCATMDKMNLPAKLQERVHQYYTHVWTEYRSLDGDIVKFQRELAYTLGLEVGLYKYMNLVMRIPFWESCSPDFATQIISNLAIRVYLPDDYVVWKGDTGDEMFMINRGICELSDPSKSQEPKNVAILASSVSATSEMVSAADGESPEEEEEEEEEEVPIAQAEIERVSSQSSVSKSGVISLLRRGSMNNEKKARVFPHKNKYEINPDEKDPNQPAKQQILLYPGQAFGEMSLLMNYQRTANIRAATYVEICIFDRAAFQRIISRYPEDRRHVLTMMLKSCIERKEIPFPWDEVVDAVAERRRRLGNIGSSRLNVHATVTATEAAQALVDRIDVNRPDESIKYGFQTFHPDLTSTSSSQVPPESSPGRTASVRRNSLVRIPSPTGDDSENAQSPSASTEVKGAQVVADARIEGLEKSMATMMDMMSSMAASIERLERQSQNRDSACCKCCPTITPTSPTREQTANPKQDATGGEARGADLTKASSPTRMKMRRRKGTSNLAPEIPKIGLEPAAKSFTQGVLPQEPPKTPQTSPHGSRLGSLCLPKALDTAAAGIGDPDSPQLTDIPRETSGRESLKNADDPFARGMSVPVEKTKSINKEPTVADQLWRRQRGERKKMGDYGKSGTVGKLTAHEHQPFQLRTRSSFPSQLEGVPADHLEGSGHSTFLGSGAEHFHRTKRRGSRVGVDAFTAPTSVEGQRLHPVEPGGATIPVPDDNDSVAANTQ